MAHYFVSTNDDLTSVFDKACKGDTIHIPDGTWHIDKTLKIGHSLSVFGKGKKKTQIVSNAEGAALIIEDSEWFCLWDVLQNECNQNSSAGIRFMDHSRGIATGNTCIQNNIGIYKAGRAHPDLEDNTCEKNEHEDYLYASATWYDATAR